MAESGGISGIAVTVAAVGGFLVYAGIRDVETITGLREILSGKKPTERKATPTVVNTLTPEKGGGQYGPWVGEVSQSSIGGPLIAEARKHLGKPYVWAAVGPNSFDCSGLVIYCLRKVYDPKTPRFTTHTFGTWARSKGFVKINEANIAAGDIIVKSGHMGIALNNTQMIHAPNRRTVVKISKIDSPRYQWSGWRKAS